MTQDTNASAPVKLSAKEQERQDAIFRLRQMLKPGDTVYTILRHVSKSGMARDISLMVKDSDGDITSITFYAARALRYSRRESMGHHAIRATGCGMDMGFDLVYQLSYCLFPKGFKVPAGKRGRNGDTSGHDSDGGYALNQRWL